MQENCFEDFSSAERVVPAILDPVYVHNGSISAPPSGTVSTPSATVKPPAKGYEAPKGTCVSNSNGSPDDWPPGSRLAGTAVGFVVAVFLVL